MDVLFDYLSKGGTFFIALLALITSIYKSAKLVSKVEDNQEEIKELKLAYEKEIKELKDKQVSKEVLELQQKQCRTEINYRINSLEDLKEDLREAKKHLTTMSGTLIKIATKMKIEEHEE